MKRNGRLYIIAGVVLAVAAGALLFLYLTSVRNEAAQKVPPATPVPDVSIVVVTKDSPVGTIITGEMLRSETRKVTEVAPDAVRSASEIVNQMLILETKAGTVLRRGDVQPIPFVLPKGKKAMAIYVDDLSSVAGLVRESDFIDVVISSKLRLLVPTPVANGQGQPANKPQPKPQGEEQDTVVVQPTDDQTTVKTVIQRIQVLKVIVPTPRTEQGQANQPPPAPTPVGTPGTVATPSGRISNQTAILVLAVTDQEAELIRFARDTATFQLLLRGRDDTENEQTKGLTLDILIRDYGLPVPRPVVVNVKSE